MTDFVDRQLLHKRGQLFALLAVLATVEMLVRARWPDESLLVAVAAGATYLAGYGGVFFNWGLNTLLEPFIGDRNRRVIGRGVLRLCVIMVGVFVFLYPFLTRDALYVNVAAVFMAGIGKASAVLVLEREEATEPGEPM